MEPQERKRERQGLLVTFVEVLVQKIHVSSLTITRAKLRPCLSVFFLLYAISFICMLYCHGAQLSQSQRLNSTCREIKFFSAGVFSWKPNMSKS